MKRLLPPRLLTLLLTLACVVFPATQRLHASPPLAYEPLPGPVPNGDPRFSTQEELEQFVDTFMEKAFSDYRLVGGVVGVVVEGQLFFTKGYGHADLEKKEPVDPATTLFRLGPVSQLFTWTGTLQLVSQGKLDLDADVNLILAESPTKLHFPQPQQSQDGTPVVTPQRAFAEPITLRNLMTHSAGIESWVTGGHLLKASDKTPPVSSAFASGWRPPRFAPPTVDFGHDRVSVHSSWGVTLAGHLMELASGQAFDPYLDEHLFKPLGMHSTSFREPPDFKLPSGSRFAAPYQFRDNVFQEMPFEHLRNFAPALSASSTAQDMLRFASAHLNAGELDGQRILSVEAIAEMHARALALNRHTNGHTLGFQETYTHGRRTLGYAGGTFYSFSELMLIPETKTALFISFNTPEGRAVRAAFKKAFLDRYFPADLPKPTPVEPPGTRDKLFTGLYRPAFFQGHTLDKLLGFDADIKVTSQRPGAVLIHGLDGTRTEWIEIEKGIVQNPDTGALATFTINDEGEVERLTGSETNRPLVKLRRWETGSFHRTLVIGCGVIFLTLLPRLLFGRGVLRRLLLMVGLIQAGAIALVAPRITTFPGDLLASIPMLQTAQGLLCFSLAFWLLSSVPLLLNLLTARGTLWARLHLLLGFIAGGAILWSAHTWNLLRIPM